MTKTEQLNRLFETWENEVPEYQGRFKRDGINDELLFQKTKPKTLFITKEPNNPEQQAGDFREWWKEKIKHTFSHRLAEWSYGLLHDFPEYERTWSDKQGLFQALHSVAFMNIKKIGGAGSSNYMEIKQHLIQNKKYVLKQIEIIDPDIIITGLTWRPLRNELFENIEWKHSGYNITIGRFGNAKVIDFYHPSARNAAAASYCLLENVVKSQNFANL